MNLGKYLLPAALVLLVCGACRNGNLFSGRPSTDPTKCKNVQVRIKNNGTTPVYKYLIKDGKHYYEFKGLQANDSTEYQCMLTAGRRPDKPLLILLSPTDTAMYVKDATDDFANSADNIISSGKVTILVKVEYKRLVDNYTSKIVSVDTRVE